MSTEKVERKKKRATIMDKIFETNSSFLVKQRTMEHV